MHATVGDHFDPMSGNAHCYNLVRVIVQDALCVGPCLVDRGVHRGLTVRFTKALEFLPVSVENNQVSQCDLARWHMRRAENSLAREARRNMSVDVDYALVLKHLAGQYHFFLEGFDGIHGVLLEPTSVGFVS